LLKINHIFYLNVDDVLSINNSRFAEFLPLIYPPELEAKETTETASSASLTFKRSNKANLLIALVQ
jgi:hypothetical protein